MDPAPPPTANSSPRISFSAEFLDEDEFISISPDSGKQQKDSNFKNFQKDLSFQRELKSRTTNAADQFEFLSGKSSADNTMITADELFFEGKLLPFWQMQHCESLNKISLRTEKTTQQNEIDEQSRVTAEPLALSSSASSASSAAAVSWFLDDDPSPRPPKCTVLWKELLRLRKQRASSLSPSSSTSSSSSSSSGSLAEAAAASSADESREGMRNNREKHGKMRIKKGLERTRSATIRVRPVINVPICTQGKTTALSPLFTLKKGKLER